VRKGARERKGKDVRLSNMISASTFVTAKRTNQSEKPSKVRDNRKSVLRQKSRAIVPEGHVLKEAEYFEKQ